MKLRLFTAVFLVGMSAIVFAAIVVFSSRTSPAPSPFPPAKAEARAIARQPRAMAQTLSFNDPIQPILSEHCFHCHGPDADSRKGELRLDRPEFAFAIRKEGG